MTLFEPSRHEALGGTPWSAAAARAAIASIVARTLRERRPDGSWAVHPQDEAGDTPAGGFKDLYWGRAGVLWALWTLQRQGAVGDLGIDVAGALVRVHEAYLAAPDSGQVVPSYFMGEAGILLARWRAASDAALEDRIEQVVRANRANPTLEALWGAPGTMLAALHLWRATRAPRWKDAFLDSVDALWPEWKYDTARGAWLWTQDMYGHQVPYFGAGHGFAGNFFPMLAGAELLDDARRELLYERVAVTLAATVRREGALANWPPGTWTPRPGSPVALVQWCHGAPGIVTSLAAYPRGRSPVVDELLAAAGELTWQAGPLAKGAGLCHGTAGNGLAFLALHARSGDARWLDRARAFAMHAIAQCERAFVQHGVGRHTLWTGDVGVAMYLWQCLDGRAGTPTLDWI